MSSSGEEELDELLRRQVIRQSRNFQNRRLFDIENPREFREKFWGQFNKTFTLVFYTLDRCFYKRAKNPIQ